MVGSVSRLPVSSSTLWLLLAAVALLLVLLGLDTDGLLLVGGATALLVGVLARLGLPLLGQGLLAVLLAGAGTVMLRRWSVRQRDRASIGNTTEEAVALEPFPPGGPGRVRWHGTSWAAVNLDGQRSIAAGSTVRVLGRESNRLQVVPHEPAP